MNPRPPRSPRREAAMRSRAERSVPYADPLHAGRHPFQTFLLVLCGVSGLPLVFGEPQANSMEQLLPQWMAVSWGASLCLGAVIGLIGSYWPRGHYATALTLERIGLLIAGPAALVYSAIILLFGGLGGLVSACIVFGFGASCLKRAHDIGVVIARAIASTEGDPLPRAQREGESATERDLAEDEES